VQIHRVTLAHRLLNVRGHNVYKIQTFKTLTGTHKNVFLTLITPFGITKNEHALELVDSEVTLEGLF
jgi:hypothetical protein